MRRPTQWSLAFLSLALLACGGSANKAKLPAVAVLKVDGSKAEKLTVELADLIRERDYRLIGGDAYAETAKDLKAERQRRSHVRKVATELGATAVVSSKLKKRGKRYSLVVTVRQGETGRKTERFTLKLRKRRLSSDERSELEERLYAALDEIIPPEVDEPPPKQKKVAEKSTKSKKKAKANQEAKAAKEREAAKKREAKERKASEQREAKERAEAAEREEAEEREREEAAAAEKPKKLSKKEVRAAKAREKKERAEKAREEKARAKKEREEKLALKKKKEAEKKKKEEDELPPVKMPTVGDDGQAIDDELPGGL